MLSDHPAIRRLAAFAGFEISPMYTNAYALVFNQIFSAGLGFLYWVLAARLYGVEVVGSSYAAISTLLLVTAFAQFSLGAGMHRFIPRAGRHTRRLILWGYGLTATSAAVTGSLALLLLGVVWPPGRAIVGSYGPVTVVLAMVLWTVFNFQDGVLIGLRKATWVFIENQIYNVTKIVLLVAGVWLLHDKGIIGSWFLPTPLLILLVGWMVFRRFIPAKVGGAEPLADVSATVDEKPLTLGEIATSVTGDHVGSLIAEVAVRLLPILVVGLLGAVQNAYFSQSWMIAMTLGSIGNGMCSSFTAEAAADRAHIATHSRAILRHMARVLVPVIVLVGVVAPLVLSLFGRDYARFATTLLRWLALAAVPAIFTSWHLAYSRVLGRIRVVATLQSIRAVLVLGISYLALPRFGIEGIGVAWLVGNLTTAVIGGIDTRGILARVVSRSSRDVDAGTSRTEPGTPPGMASTAQNGTAHTVVVISPHLDDAVLSCGGALARLVESGASVTVVTVCTSDPEAGRPLSAFARRAHAAWALGDAPFEERRREDAAALAALGARGVHLGLRDAVYRTDDSGRPLYESPVGEPVNPLDRAGFLVSLREMLDPLLTTACAAPERCRVFCPIGVGGHIDHVLTREAVESLCPAESLVYFEEFPYTVRSATADDSDRDESLRPCCLTVLELTPAEVETRIDAIACYDSQLRGLFPSPYERLAEIVGARLPALGRALLGRHDAAASRERMAARLRQEIARSGGERYRWLDVGQGSPF